VVLEWKTEWKCVGTAPAPAVPEQAQEPEQEPVLALQQDDSGGGDGCGSGGGRGGGGGGGGRFLLLALPTMSSAALLDRPVLHAGGDHWEKSGSADLSQWQAARLASCHRFVQHQVTHPLSAIHSLHAPLIFSWPSSLAVR